jgi:membrane-bound lytic murein transglycosylase F
LQVVEVSEGDIFSLLESVGSQKIELAAMDSTLIDIATQFVPSLQTTLYLSENVPLVWWLGKKPNLELTARVSDFVEKAQRDGTLARIEERYFGHVRRLKQADISKFLGRTETMLPKLRKYFHTAQALSGLDWRLIAAVAYHESHWDPNATSPTGVRGIMMLTEETADRLGVSNRLDPRESIMAGARYLNLLKRTAGRCPGTRPHLAGTGLLQHRPRPFQRGTHAGETIESRPNGLVRNEAGLALLAQPKYYER